MQPLVGCIAGDNRPHRSSQLHTANWNRSEVEAISPVCRSHGKQCRKVVNDVTPTAAFPTLNVVSGQICLSPSRRLAFTAFTRHSAAPSISRRRRIGSNYKQIELCAHTRAVYRANNEDLDCALAIIAQINKYSITLTDERSVKCLATCPVALV